jgi:hypothetical protein
MGKQTVKMFQGGRDFSDDERMAKKIEQYAIDNKVEIQLISYAVGLRYGYAMVVFKEIDS